MRELLDLSFNDEAFITIPDVKPEEECYSPLGDNLHGECGESPLF